MMSLPKERNQGRAVECLVRVERLAKVAMEELVAPQELGDSVAQVEAWTARL